MHSVLSVLHSLPRVTIVEATDTYIHSVFTTRIMRFKDDVEFFFPRNNDIIHFRSASRIGQSDMGKNHSRMEMVREAILEALQIQ